MTKTLKASALAALILGFVASIVLAVAPSSDAASTPKVKQAISAKWFSVKEGKCYANVSSKTWYTDGKIVYKETSTPTPGKCK